MKRDGLTIIDNDGNEIVHFSEEELEHLSEVAEATNFMLTSLEEGIREQAIKNFMKFKLIEGYPENGGICFISNKAMDNYVDEVKVDYDLDEPIDRVIDRQRKQLAKLEDEDEALDKKIDLFGITYDKKDDGYEVIAIDEDRIRDKGVKWVADKLARTPKEHKEIRREAKEWINRNTEDI